MAPDEVATPDLRAILALERLDRVLFRAINAEARVRTTLYGGQVAAQALLAAAATVDEGRVPHSLHGYFLRPGRPDMPVILRVDRDRDGRSFSARHVVAVQDGAVIFSMVASFHLAQPTSIFDDAPHRGAPDPDATPSGIVWGSLVEVREVTPTDVPRRIFADLMWVRSAVALGDDPLVHAAALTYLSDLGSGFGQLDQAVVGGGGPSIDHSMWFHEPIRADDWVLIDLRPIKAGSARGVYQGSLRDRSGRLGAVVCQECLLLPVR